MAKIAVEVPDRKYCTGCKYFSLKHEWCILFQDELSEDDDCGKYVRLDSCLKAAIPEEEPSSTMPRTKPMTKFEKWKEELTVDDLTESRERVGINCSICPASILCESFSNTCYDTFIAWAQMEYEEPELKPCPCCGGKAEFRATDGYIDVRCKKCGVRTLDHGFSRQIPSDRIHAMNDAAAEWNRRP